MKYIIKKIRNKILFLVVYIKLRHQGYNKILAALMAQNYIDFKYN